MQYSRGFAVAIGLLAFTSFAVGTALQVQQSAPLATPQALGQGGGPAWHDTQDIGNGVELETVVKFCENVTIPATGETVRPISLHINLLYGVGVMQQIDYLKLHPIADAATLSFSMFGLDRNIVIPQRPPLGALNYLLTLTPKNGYTWGTIRGAIDLNIVAIPQ